MQKSESILASQILVLVNGCLESANTQLNLWFLLSGKPLVIVDGFLMKSL